jgi:hypothetical protein
MAAVAAAAARVVVAAAGNYGRLTTSYFFLHRPFSATSTSISRALRLNPSLNGWPRRRFTCRAVYNPEEVLIKEEDQPKTLDYRVFLVNHSGKKVCFFFFSVLIIFPFHFRGCHESNAFDLISLALFLEKTAFYWVFVNFLWVCFKLLLLLFFFVCE